MASEASEKYALGDPPLQDPVTTAYIFARVLVSSGDVLAEQTATEAQPVVPVAAAPTQQQPAAPSLPASGGLSVPVPQSIGFRRLLRSAPTGSNLQGFYLVLVFAGAAIFLSQQLFTSLGVRLRLRDRESAGTGRS